MKKTATSVICHDIEGKTYEVAVGDLSFRPAVYGVIVQDNRVLLSKQWDGYDFPGGGIELGETTEQALVREVKEETGMDVQVGGILHSGDSFFKLPYKGQFVHSIHLYYECKIVGGEISTEFFDEQEKKYADKPEWIELSRVKDVKIYSSGDTAKILAKYL